MLYEFGLYFIVKITERELVSFPIYQSSFSSSSWPFFHSFHFFSTLRFSFTCVAFFAVGYYSDTFALYRVPNLTTSEDYRQNTKMFVLIGMETGILKQKNEWKKRNDGFKYLYLDRIESQLLAKFSFFCSIFTYFFFSRAYFSKLYICEYYHKERIDLCSIVDKREKKRRWKKNAHRKRYINGHRALFSFYCSTTLNRLLNNENSWKERAARIYVYLQQ